MNAYLIGADVLGASIASVAAKAAGKKVANSDYGDTFGPLSPEDLVKLDRKLTPEETTAALAWQAQQAEAYLAAERAKGGPQSQTVSVTEKGAVIERQPAPRLGQPRPAAVPVPTATGVKWWHVLGIVAGAAALGYVTYQTIGRGDRNLTRVARAHRVRRGW